MIEFTIEMLIESDKSFQQIICILLLDKNLDETLMWTFFCKSQFKKSICHKMTLKREVVDGAIEG